MLSTKWIPTPLTPKENRPVIPFLPNATPSYLRRTGVFLGFSWLLVQFLFLKLSGKLTPRLIGMKLSHFCQKKGLLWIKVGQLLSMRSDIFPPELCEELARLQEKAMGFKPQEALQVIGEEIGEPETIFQTFIEEPWAAASIAQVHRAYLKKEKKWVAVKVKRPGLDRIFKQDMSLIRYMFSMLNFFSFMPYMRWADLLWELDQIFTEELDFRYEITNQMRLRKTLGRHSVYVPFVYKKYCSEKVMVMEFLEGVSMAEFLEGIQKRPKRTRAWLMQNQIQPEVVGKTLLFSYLRQILEDNLFHADLHPGNILLLKDNRIALLDFGSVGHLEKDTLRKYDAYLVALSHEQFSKAIDVFLLTAPNMPGSNITQLKEEILRSLGSWRARCRVKELPYEQKSAVCVLDEMTRVMTKYGFTILWSFFKVLRGWTTMDASLRTLIPRADLLQLMAEFHKERQKRALKKALLYLPKDLLMLQKLVDLPQKQLEMGLYRGAMIRRLAQVFEGATSSVSSLGASIFSLCSAGLFCLLAMLFLPFSHQHLGLSSKFYFFQMLPFLNQVPRLDSQIWLVLFSTLGYACYLTRKLAIEFRKVD